MPQVIHRRPELFSLARPEWRATWLCFDGDEFCRTREALLRNVAKQRGCGTVAETARFLFEPDEFPHPFAGMPVYAAARERLRRALFGTEKIALYADYDCDGVSSLLVLFELLKGGGAQTALYIPDRLTEGYGLTLHGARACYERHRPSLLFALDCGSTSVEAVAWLRTQGVDTIVIDHHKVDASELLAVSLLNPKALGDFAGDLNDMTAAGLAFSFAEQVAADLGLTNWNRERSMVLAGIGTFVDVAPLHGVNRMLVKAALSRLNKPGWLAAFPGLRALASGLGIERFDEVALGFGIGPLINAPGRVGHARDVVRCLVASDDKQADFLAAGILATNQRRRELQEQARRSAERKAAALMQAPCPPKVIFICDEEYHPGVVGIVASRLREKFNRPTILCGSAGDGFWTGSGRSCAGFSLGNVVLEAVRAGLLAGGGGHDMAAGVRLCCDRAEAFDAFLQRAAADWHLPSGLDFELLGVADAQTAAEWLIIMAALEPFGVGNPRPKLVLERAVVVGAVHKLQRRTSGEAWALRALVESERGKRLVVTWPDVDAAEFVLQTGKAVQLILDVYEDRRGGPARAEWMVYAGVAM